MNEPAEDLWPHELTDVDSPKPPSILLQEQATLLGNKTQNLVEAEVNAEPLGEGVLMVHFTLVAPALSGYRYDLIKLRQPATLYPLEVYFDDNIWKADSEEAFKQCLREIFNSAITKRIINAMIAQSKL